jgi:hypothetical protein
VPGVLCVGSVLGLVFLGVGFILSNEMSWPLSQSVGGVGFAVVVASQMAARRR